MSFQTHMTSVLLNLKTKSHAFSDQKVVKLQTRQKAQHKQVNYNVFLETKTSIASFIQAV